MALSLAGFGVLPLVLGDLKPDYVDLIAALDGQVIRLGRGRGYLNVLDIDTRQARRRAARRRRARASSGASCSPTRSAAGTRWSRR